MQLDNPESKKVAEVAKAAGEAWRAMPQEQKDGYEDLSTEAKVTRSVTTTTPAHGLTQEKLPS